MPGIETLILIVLTLARGAVTAAQVALGAGLLASSLGLLLALLVVFAHNRVLQAVTAVYIEWMRNVPALAHLFVLYFGLASVGVRLSPLTAAVIGLGLVGAAILCEVFAAGLRCVLSARLEEALDVGLTPEQVMLKELLTTKVRVTLPSLGNYASQLVKDTSIASAIAAPEVMFYARNLVTSTFETPIIYLTAMLLYAAMVLPISWAFARLERSTAGGAR